MLRTNKQTDKQTVSNILPTLTDIVGVSNYCLRCQRVHSVRLTNDNQTVCCRLVGGLLASMSEAELSELEQTDLYRRSPVLIHARRNLSKNALAEKSIVMELHKIPERHIGE